MNDALFFNLSSLWLAVILAAIVFGATTAGILLGRRLRHRSEHLREPFSAVQGALLGFVGLILAFGLALAVGRYEARRAAVVDEANAIGTTYLRAQTLREPVRSRSLDLLRRYTATTIRVSQAVPGSSRDSAAIAQGEVLQRALWGQAGRALTADPTANPPRLYMESLNESFDAQETKISGLNNRVPTPVLVVEVAGAAIALGLLALFVSLLGRGTTTVWFAAGLITVLLFVTFDLDRPTRGLITVPTTPLTDLQRSFALPPAYPGPGAG